MTGTEFKALRQSWGMTQLALARLLEYDVKTISAIENGRKVVPKMLEKVMLRENALRAIKKLLDSLDTHL